MSRRSRTGSCGAWRSRFEAGGRGLGLLDQLEKAGGWIAAADGPIDTSTRTANKATTMHFAMAENELERYRETSAVVHNHVHPDAHPALIEPVLLRPRTACFLARHPRVRGASTSSGVSLGARGARMS